MHSFLFDRHFVASVSIAGSCLDVLGSLYLAYDLLGGQKGPLRLLTRAVTYSIVFGVGYGLGLGLFFGLVAGTAIGVTISIEMSRVSRGFGHYPPAWEACFSTIRGIAFFIGLYRMVGVEFAAAFALLVTGGTIFAYSRGIRPTMDYSAARRARFTRKQLWGTIIRTIGYTVSALVGGALVHRADHAWWFAIRVGLVTGLVTGFGVMVNPYIEYYADNLPERRLGAFGIGLILCGFALQSLQYWLVVLDVRVT